MADQTPYMTLNEIFNLSKKIRSNFNQFIFRYYYYNFILDVPYFDSTSDCIKFASINHQTFVHLFAYYGASNYDFQLAQQVLDRYERKEGHCSS